MLANNPWAVQRSLLVLDKCEPGMVMEHLRANKVPIWLRFFWHTDGSVAYEHGNMAGEVVQLDMHIDGFQNVHALRVKVLIEPAKPLFMGACITLSNGDKVWVSCTPERSYRLCEQCGRIEGSYNQVLVDVPMEIPENNSVPPVGNQGRREDQNRDHQFEFNGNLVLQAFNVKDLSILQGGILSAVAEKAFNEPPIQSDELACSKYIQDIISEEVDFWKQEQNFSTHFGPLWCIGLPNLSVYDSYLYRRVNEEEEKYEDSTIRGCKRNKEQDDILVPQKKLKVESFNSSIARGEKRKIVSFQKDVNFAKSYIPYPKRYKMRLNDVMDKWFDDLEYREMHECIVDRRGARKASPNQPPKEI
ncbi:uncharacterized protein G2W53_018174 [Senna tora]|uniref:Uncharacterized protein n=1 Tax=Senna tora TaxID=362788 RepID=A0A834TRD7_9FABA|nr:uncharacterized protein G2W53_018174 [Senna tora]